MGEIDAPQMGRKSRGGPCAVVPSEEVSTHLSQLNWLGRSFLFEKRLNKDAGAKRRSRVVETKD
jgi:hypothetical protein